MRAALPVVLLTLLQIPTVSAVPIVVGSEADPLVRLAGGELTSHLSRLYPDKKFEVVNRSDESPRVLLGIGGSSKELDACAGGSQSGADSFAVKSAGGVGCIAGGDPRGVLYGVYALLEELGFGFCLSYTAFPPPRTEFALTGWNLADRPLVSERLVFNWHNFLSSASTWELADWRHYIDQASRMRYTGILVHAYGNNPMFAFEHNGVSKPVGYLTTTRSGRDWGSQHVNDVRRLYGAAGILEEPVFGASAAMVPGEERVNAATGLMQKVFQHAESRGMDVSFAVDVDTLPANPQSIIRTLPEKARFRSGDVELPIPTTLAGEDYYRSLVRTLLITYPEIDQVVVWFRRARTPWMTLTPDDLPDAWKMHFRAAMEINPELADDERAAPMYALGHVMAAFDRLIDETGRTDVQLAAGSWDLPYFPAADAMFPAYVKLMPLDWSIKFRSLEVQSALRKASLRRKVTPIVWAHHDDHTYIGRPYRPFSRFASLLAGHNASGFGIIHWTTRPLDLYFKSLARQTWEASRDEALDVTVDRMASRSFGGGVAKEAAAYLMRWIEEAPMFGRETSDRFIDRPLGDTHQVASQAEARWAILNEMKKADLSDTGLDVWAYYRDLERFIASFYIAHNDLERSLAALEAGNLDKARKDIGKPVGNPELAIEQYGIAARQQPVNRGETALLISLNLRWLPYFRAQKQVLGLEPIRINFQPTQHDPLAQGAGHFTYFFEEDGTIWKAIGEQETGLPVFETTPLKRSPKGWDPDLLTSGIVVTEPATLELTALGNRKILDGEYKITLYYRGDTNTPGKLVEIEQTQAAVDGKLPVKLKPASSSNKLCAAIIQPSG
jgi:hypothetical protein